MARPKGSSTKGRKKAMKDPNKPKRAMSAYFCFMKAYREECKKKNIDVSKVAEFTREASGKWRNMDEEQRKPYEEESAKGKAAYELAMQQYVPPKGMKKTKRSKDPNKPKRPPTSYILFLNDFRKKNKDTLSHTQVMVKAGDAWRNMNANDKSPYEKQALEEKKAYDVKVDQLKNGKSAPPPPKEEEEEEMDEDEEEEDEEDEESDE